MIDHITAETPIKHFPSWRKKISVSLFIGMDALNNVTREIIKRDTIIRTYYGYYRGYNLIVTEFEQGLKMTHILKIKGSLHKNINDGIENYSPVTHIKIVQEILTICKDLCISANETKLNCFEIGLPILFPIPVYNFLKRNLLFYSTAKERTDFKTDEKKKIGFYFKLTDYDFKVYDSALRHRIEDWCNIMKVEIHFKRMRELNNMGVFYLSDLLLPEKVAPLIDALVSRWDKVLLADDTIDPTQLTKNDRDVFDYCSRRDYLESWRELPSSTADSRKKSYNYLVSKHGNDYHLIIRNSLIGAWRVCLNSYYAYSGFKMELRGFSTIPSVGKHPYRKRTDNLIIR